jgi:hypothetical protein
MKSSNPKEPTMQISEHPFKVKATATRSGAHKWQVTVRKGDIIEHRKFDTEDEAQGFIESNK